MNAQNRLTDKHTRHMSVAELRAEARERGLDPALSDDALRRSVAEARGAEFMQESRAAIEAMNRWVEKNGLPLAEYRPF